MKVKPLILAFACILLLCSCSFAHTNQNEEETSSKVPTPAAIPTSTCIPTLTAIPTPTCIPTPVATTVAEKAVTVPPQNEVTPAITETPYDKYTCYNVEAISSTDDPKEIEQLYTRYLCKDWQDTKENTHTITADSFDGKKISITYGLIYNDNCFGFYFNFVDTPLQYPLFLTYVIDDDYILLETSTGYEPEDQEIHGTDAYVYMLWTSEGGLDQLKKIFDISNIKTAAYDAIM